MEEIVSLWSKYGPSLLIVLATGICGGIINCLMFEDGFTLPHSFTSKKGIKTWSPGFLTNIFFGIVASFLVWAFGAKDLDLIKQAGIGILAGTSGNNVILNFLQKKQLAVEKTKANEYLDMIRDELVEDQEEDDEQEQPRS
jgi:hypothetical protein